MLREAGGGDSSSQGDTQIINDKDADKVGNNSLATLGIALAVIIPVCVVGVLIAVAMLIYLQRRKIKHDRESNPFGRVANDASIYLELNQSTAIKDIELKEHLGSGNFGVSTCVTTILPILIVVLLRINIIILECLSWDMDGYNRCSIKGTEGPTTVERIFSGSCHLEESQPPQHRKILWYLCRFRRISLHRYGVCIQR